MPRLTANLPRLWGNKLQWESGVRKLATAAETAVQQVSQAEEVSQVQPARKVSEKILQWSREAIAEGRAHFKVGGKQLYFPKARVILLRPNAKHTPYQAKFIVPKSFNKLDLRDYLFHVYGLRAMNVTTQLLHAKYTRANQVMPRYREGQIKKMTIDMAEPFVWPEEPRDKEPWAASLVKELGTYRSEQTRLGSDAFKPGRAFDGALGPYKPAAQPFVPRMMRNKMLNQRARSQAKASRLGQVLKVDRLVRSGLQ